MSLNPAKAALQPGRSSAIRQALVFFAVFAVITTMTWLATYWMAERETKRLVETRLQTLVDTTLLTLEKGGTLPAPGPGQYLALVRQNGEMDGALPPDYRLLHQSPGFSYEDLSDSPGGLDLMVLISDQPEYRLVAAENVERLEEIMEIYLTGLQLALLVSLLATFFAGVWLARRNQSRIDRISHSLAQVSAGDLSSRIKLDGPQDDLRILAERIDATTERLASVMQQVRVQTANIAHDLRTPLARLRASMEQWQSALVEKAKPVSDADMQNAIEQIDNIDGIFNAILRISQIESGVQKSSFRRLSLADLLDTVADTFGPVVEDQGQVLRVQTNNPQYIVGDRDMLIQLLANLIQNALRYASQGRQMLLSCDGSTVSVVDQGPGIPDEERQVVLRPLYQRDKQRQVQAHAHGQGCSKGYGLGLALVVAICDLHGAELSLGEGPDGVGLAVTMQFPEA